MFDWIWADAWQRAGLRYYPKLVAAVPFSPVSAPKVIGDAGESDALLDAAIAETTRSGASSLHLLFVDERLAGAAETRGCVLRHDCQFHWHNRGYRTFDDFLAALRAAKRKQIRKERQRAQATGLAFHRRSGSTISPELWDHIHALTERSFMLRGNRHYLDADCHRLLGERLGDALQVFTADDQNGPVAAAVCLKGDDRLYGRYWGTCVDVPGLHFELCFYQGIEYCIEAGLAAFEPGAQGEHKLLRGFEPTRTISAHWIAAPQLRDAVADWCAREREMVARYIEAAAEHLPFRRT